MKTGGKARLNGVDIIDGKTVAEVMFYDLDATTGVLDDLIGKDVKITLSKWSDARSLNSNRYLWALCQEIAEAVSPSVLKEDVYRSAVYAVGEFETLYMHKDAVESFRHYWEAQGDGWIADDKGELVDELNVVHAYFGSSTYTQEQMNRLVDYIVNEAESIGVHTATVENLREIRKEQNDAE